MEWGQAGRKELLGGRVVGISDTTLDFVQEGGIMGLRHRLVVKFRGL